MHPGGALAICGAGPAGSAAAIAAIQRGREVTLFDQSAFPRHKVCGEFLSSGIELVLERLGVWREFEGAGPALIRSMALHFGNRVKHSRLPDVAYGLSRYRFDALLCEKAVSLGARFIRERVGNVEPGAILATGRQKRDDRGTRLFGFKAHFSGPVRDAVELFFFERCYVGVNQIEVSLTNVCGIAPESVLARYGFDPDLLIASAEPLKDRLAPLSRSMEWLFTGPVVPGQAPELAQASRHYLAGDALGFIDPFTGTGILNALLTGELAGMAAAGRLEPELHFANCRRAVSRAFRYAEFFRAFIGNGWAERLAPLVPGKWLYALTRPTAVL